MKKLIIAVAALMVSIAAYGQGQFVLNNRITADGINARFILNTDPATGASSSVGSPDFTVNLLGGAQGTPTAQLVALDPSSTTFRGAAGTATAGYLTQVTPVVPGVAPGSPASIVLRVLGPGVAGGQQDFGPYNVNLGGGTITPPNLPMGGNPLVVQIPEPTTLALGALGLGALFLIRRRK
jgi:hypothetical protein